MKRITFARLAVLLLAAGALALSGCGGDDNGVDQSLLDTVMDDLDAETIRADDATARADKAEADLKEAQDAPAEDSAAQMALAEAMRKESNARGKSITTAIAGFFTEMLTGGELVITHNPTPGAPTGLKLANTEADGLMITPDGKPPLQFEEYEMAAGYPPMIDGWQGVTLMREIDNGDATQTVYAYTDIEPATMKTFGAVHGTSVRINDQPDSMETGKIGLAKSSEFPTAMGEAGAQSYPAGDIAFAGTYDKVAGTFDCAAGCTVTRLADGKHSVTAGTLIFKPTNASDMVTVADAQYLYFGLWLQKPDAAHLAHPFATFAGGADAFEVNDDAIMPMIGRAKYEGPAAGKYVTRNLAADSTEIGLFTATAELIADFEAPNPTLLTPETARAPSNVGMLNGSVSKFMKGDEPLANWRVMLDATPLAPLGVVGNPVDGVTPPPTMMVTGRTSGRIGAATDSAMGNWQAQFFGNNRMDGDPAAVAGRFDLTDSHATLSGAFGAYNTEDDK